MPFDLTIQNLGDYLRAEVSGKRDSFRQLEDTLSVWAAVAQKCEEEGIRKVLAIWNVPGPLSIPTIFEVWSRPDRFGWDIRTKFAAVFPDAEGIKHSKFAENVGRNRGVKSAVFDNEEAAKEWLLRPSG